MHARGESLCESRMRETCTSGSTRGEVRSLFYSLPLLLYRYPSPFCLLPTVLLPQPAGVCECCETQDQEEDAAEH